MTEFDPGDEVSFNGVRWVVMGCSCASISLNKTYTLSRWEGRLVEALAPARLMRLCED